MSDRTKVLFLVGLLVGLLGVPVVLAITDSETVAVSDDVTVQSPDGTAVTIQGTTNVSMEQLFPDSSTVDMTTDAGNVTFVSSGEVAANIAKSNITGTYTVVEGIDATNADIDINPEDKSQVTVGDNIDRIEFRSTTDLDDSTTDFIYNASSGTSTVVLNTVPADTPIAAVDADSGTVLDSADSDGSGTVTFDSLDSGDHTVELKDASDGPQLDDSSMSPTQTVRTENVTLSIDVDDPDFPSETVTLEWYVDGTKVNTTTANSAGTHTAIADQLSEGTHEWNVTATDSTGVTTTSATQNFAIEHYSPEISKVSPEGGLQAEPSSASAQINDSDFDGDGDELTYYVSVDGNQIGTSTLQSNGTISETLPSSAKTGGQHTLNITVTDDWNKTTTEIVTYSVPDELFVRNETDHTQLVPASGEVRFYGGDQVFTRNTTDGTLNMTGLPVDQNFIVEIEPTSDDYTDRTVFIESIFEQQDAYVLNTTAYDTVESRFELNDPTGEYDAESVVKIRRAINTSSSTTFQTIVADRFGAEGVTATLQNDTRYRLAVTNEESEQTVGPYRATVSETVQVKPGQPTIDLNTTDSGWAADASVNNQNITYRYQDADNQTSEVTVYIHERGDEDNLLTANETYSNLGDASGKVALTDNESEKEWVVKFDANRDSGDVVKAVPLSEQRDVTPPIDQGWLSMIAVGLLVLLAGAFSMLNAGIGAVIVSIAGGLLWFLGFLAGMTSAAAVVIALFVSILGHAYSTTR